jgi:hypothetical protein
MYKVKSTKIGGCGRGSFIHVLLIVLTAGLWGIVYFLIVIIDEATKSNIAKPGEELQCEICGYTWIFEE